MRRLRRGCVILCVGALLALTGGCEDKKATTQPQNVQPRNDTDSMFQQMNQGAGQRKPSAPTTGNTAPAAAVENVDVMPGFVLEESPECKALKADRKVLRDRIEVLNRDLVGPATQKKEAASRVYEACQEDVGCVNNLDRYEAKHRAFQSAKTTLRSAEAQVEQLETQLYQISQKMAARCDTDPL